MQGSLPFSAQVNLRAFPTPFFSSSCVALGPDNLYRQSVVNVQDSVYMLPTASLTDERYENSALLNVPEMLQDPRANTMNLHANGICTAVRRPSYILYFVHSRLGDSQGTGLDSDPSDPSAPKDLNDPSEPINMFVLSAKPLDEKIKASLVWELCQRLADLRRLFKTDWT